MAFAPSALPTRYFLAPRILLAQIYPPNSTFIESPMVLSNPRPHPLDTVCLVSGPSGPQLYGPPYLFFGNSTTDCNCLTKRIFCTCNLCKLITLDYFKCLNINLATTARTLLLGSQMQRNRSGINFVKMGAIKIIRRLTRKYTENQEAQNTT